MPDQFNGNTYYLVRHGESDNNVRNLVNGSSRVEYRLTEKGRRQALAAAEFLTAFPIDFLVSSPIPRTAETAQILQEWMATPLTFDDRLTESRFGRFEGTDVASFRKYMHEHGGRTVGDPELGVEGYMDIRERVRSFLDDVSETFQGKHIVFVSHSDTLQELYAELLGEPVGAEQGDRGWYPKQGSCLVIGADGVQTDYTPKG